VVAVADIIVELLVYQVDQVAVVESLKTELEVLEVLEHLDKDLQVQQVGIVVVQVHILVLGLVEVLLL
jgi:hypothetical protein